MDQGPSSQVAAPVGAPPYRPDWYPDPTGRFEFRYHNGQAWTGDVSVDGNRFLDPLSPYGSGAGWPSAEGLRPTFAPTDFAPDTGSGRARAAFVLGLCSFLIGWVPFLCIVAIIGAVVGLVLGIGVLRRDARARRDGAGNSRAHGYAVAGVALAPLGLAISVLGVWLSVVAIREVRTFANVGAHTITDIRCDVSDSVATYAGTITNDSPDTHSYQVTVEFLRPGTSARLHIASTTVDDVEPGESGQIVVSESVPEDELDCRVLDVTGPLPFGQS